MSVCSLFFFLGQMLPENIIIGKKILLAYHLFNLPPDSIGRQIAEEQRNLAFPGLISEVRQFLAEINVRESLIKNTSKAQFKAIIRSRMKEKNRQEVLNMMKNLKKIDYFQLKDNNYKINEVFKTLTLSQARTHFLILTNMVRAKLNYMSDPVYSRDLYKCECEEGLLSSTQHF